jgi:hypothetical protein
VAQASVQRLFAEGPGERVNLAFSAASRWSIVR